MMDQLAKTSSRWCEVPLLLVATTLVFIEESVYRGFALPPLRRRFGLGAALAISSICFGFLHWGNGVFAIGATSVIGLFFALVFVGRRNLIAVTGRTHCTTCL